MQSIPWYYRWFYFLVIAAVGYYFFRVYRWLLSKRKPQEAQSEIELINHIYRGLNTEQSDIQRAIDLRFTWIVRIKQLQTLLYVVIAGLLLWWYRTPSFILQVPYAQLALGVPVVSIYLLQILRGHEEGRIKDLEKQRGDLKVVLRDTEKMLTDQLDPSLYKNLKMIIKREMKQELQQLRND